MFCPNCGREILSNEKHCAYCGSKNEAYVENVNVDERTKYNYSDNNAYSSMTQEDTTLGTLAIVFSALGTIVGLILAIIGLSRYKDPSNRRKCKIALYIYIGWAVFIFIFILFWLTILLSVLGRS